MRPSARLRHREPRRSIRLQSRVILRRNPHHRRAQSPRRCGKSSEPLAGPATVGRESLTPAEFDFVRQLIRDYAGIVIGDNKRSMVQGRISRRMRELGIRDVGEYLGYIRTAPEVESDGLASALTTNVTAFFREGHH